MSTFEKKNNNKVSCYSFEIIPDDKFCKVVLNSELRSQKENSHVLYLQVKLDKTGSGRRVKPLMFHKNGSKSRQGSQGDRRKRLGQT